MSKQAEEMLKLEQTERGTIVQVRAYAGSKRNSVLGVREGALRVAVTAAPEKGKANKAIVALLSKTLGMAKSAIELLSGATSQQKRFLMVGCDAQQIRQSVEVLVASSEK